MHQIVGADLRICAEADGSIKINRGNVVWVSRKDHVSGVELTDGSFVPLSAAKTRLETLTCGTGEGLRWTWEGIPMPEGQEPLCLAGELRIENESGNLLFTLLPIRDGILKAVHWPAELQLSEESSEGCTVLPMMQGVLLPDHWPGEVKGIEPPCFLERHGYMPWVGRYCEKGGWMAIAETPWDAGYGLEHPAGGPTRLDWVWQESMGYLSYGRRLRMILFSKCDYVTMCKEYRSYIREKGSGRTLREKVERSPKILDLFGASVIHTEIRYEAKKEAACYDWENPEKNSRLTTFEERRKQLKALHDRGLEKAYVHLDGWGKAGYDREHPDILPPCEEAGGAEGLRKLSGECRALGYRFALHDQYRDYYTEADTYDQSQAVMLPDGSRPGECTWTGGKQSYLCAGLASSYVRRNYRRLEKMGICPDGAYLDVFSVMRLDECFDPMHPMTRRECSEYRNECFHYIEEHYGIVSSEEPLSNTVDSLALCHHAPYPTSPTLARGYARGIPVPLFNLVYHDCILTPWNLAEGEESVMPDGKSGFLYALLNGGMGYLPIEPSDEEWEKAGIVARLHSLVADQEMVLHEFMDGTGERQKTVFANGITVEVDFMKGSYRFG